MYKLMIVDDEAIIRRGLSQIIKWEQLGFILTAQSGSALEALELMQNTEIDVLLTDISMPEMNGLELIRAAKTKNPLLKTVVISGYSEFDYAIEAIKLKAEDYILKPLDPNKINQVFSRIKQTLDQEREQQSKESFLQADYELMRLLHSDTDSMRHLPGDHNEQKRYRVVLFKIESCSSSEKARLSLEALLSGYFYRQVDNLIAAAVAADQADLLVQRFESQLEPVDDAIYRAAVSMAFSSLSDITTAYLTAVDVLKWRCSDRVVYYDKLVQIDKKEKLGQYHHRFIQQIESGAFDGLAKISDQLFQQLNEIHITGAYEFCVRILRNIVLYFRIEDVPFFHISTLSKKFLDDEAPLTSQELRSCFDIDLQELILHLKAGSESVAAMIGSQARCLVDTCYADKNLSLSSVAEQLNVSYGYLSTVFTKAVGENFKAYVVSVRMEKARELIMERRYKIYEIADLVGYSSPRYFTDAFKKKYGISPVDYLSRIGRQY